MSQDSYGKFQSISKLFLIFTILLVTSGFMFAQDATGSLTGDIKDTDGGPLPGVTVTAKNVSNGDTKTAYSDVEGKFSFPNLPAGTYDVGVELGGFITVEKTDIAINAGNNELSFTMKPGGLAELMVVTASKIETPLINAPATISVVNSTTIESSPAQNYADLLRSVPGLNVTQTSARDINITSRQANSTLATSQLALLDGRSIYLDFFGFIAWDFLPVNFNEIKQIEVIRGPASAVWGANAQTGVVNILTKSPRETTGTSVTLTGGFFDRNVEGEAGTATVESDQSNGGSFGANMRFAQAVNEQWAYKISGGYFYSDPLARPIGIIPPRCLGPDRPDDSVVCSTGEVRTGGVPYALADFTNHGTQQPRFDVRVDDDLSDDSRLQFTGGVAGTDGIIHTGIGPFDIQSGTVLGYGKVGYNKGNFKLNFFTNILDGDALNEFGAVGIDGKPIDFIFKSQTYDIESSNITLLGDKNILSYGGNYRRNNFDISLAPNGDDRNEIGGYIQDEFFTDKIRLVIGARLDKFSVIDDPVFSPRVTFMFKPAPAHSIRASFNRAFQSPSQINNFLDVVIINAVFLPPPVSSLFFFPTGAKGNQDLVEQSLTAYEVGYTGEFNGRSTVSFSYYINDVDDNINFTPFLFYSAQNPPPNWPLPPQFVPPNTLPLLFTYLNLGPLRQQGFEASLDQVVNNWSSFFVNYSYQKDPEILDNSEGADFPFTEVIYPPNHRFNAGVNFDTRKWLGSFSVNYQSEAFWTDVLDARFFGPTDSFTQVNASFGYRWMDGRVTTSIKINNLLNEQIQQHIFGDVLKRSVNFEARFDF